jgi:hypothetical protein
MFLSKSALHFTQVYRKNIESLTYLFSFIGLPFSDSVETRTDCKIWTEYPESWTNGFFSKFQKIQRNKIF